MADVKRNEAPVLKMKLVEARPNRETQTKLDTLELTIELAESWKPPPFQRPLKINDKVRALAETVARDQVIPGILTLGVLGTNTYLLDGQHRRAAFMLAVENHHITSAFVDVRVHHFESMGDMGQEFVNLNSQLVRMTPDDIIRGLEDSTPALRLIRQRCNFVGYDSIRRGGHSPVLSMALLLRCWQGAGMLVPSRSSDPVIYLVNQLNTGEAETLAEAASILFTAWGRDPQYQRLWSSLNLVLCFWVYRRMVLTQYSPRTPKLTKQLFQKCMMALSTDDTYLDWLVGRNVGERDRSPGYGRMRVIIAKRAEAELGRKINMPSPDWASHSGFRGNRKK